MYDHSLARLQAKIYIKRNFMSLFGLYALCRAVYSAVYIILILAASVFFSGGNAVFFGTVAQALASLVSAPVVFGIIERYKNKHFPKRLNFSQPITSSVFLGVVVGAFSMINLITLYSTWQMLVLVVLFLGTSVFSSFYVYNLLVREDSLNGHIRNTRHLFSDAGLVFFKNLLMFIPMGFLAAAIVGLPQYTIQVNSLLSGLSPMIVLAITEASTVLFSLVGVLPAYVEIKMYLSIYFLFSQSEPDFDFAEYIK